MCPVCFVNDVTGLYPILTFPGHTGEGKRRLFQSAIAAKLLQLKLLLPFLYFLSRFGGGSRSGLTPIASFSFLPSQRQLLINQTNRPLRIRAMLSGPGAAARMVRDFHQG